MTEGRPPRAVAIHFDWIRIFLPHDREQSPCLRSFTTVGRRSGFTRLRIGAFARNLHWLKHAIAGSCLIHTQSERTSWAACGPGLRCMPRMRTAALRTSAGPVNRFPSLGLGGSHIGKPKVEENESIRLIRQAIGHRVCTSWTIPGTTTTARARSAWAKRFRDGYRDRRFPDDQNRRPDQRRSRQTDRRIAAPPADRPRRSGAAPRGDPLRRSRPDLSPRAAHGGVPRSQEGRQAALHRLHRTQGPARPPVHARRSPRHTASSSIPCRCR